MMRHGSAGLRITSRRTHAPPCRTSVTHSSQFPSTSLLVPQSVASWTQSSASQQVPDDDDKTQQPLKAPAKPATPAEHDMATFRADDSVSKWRAFTVPMPSALIETPTGAPRMEAPRSTRKARSTPDYDPKQDLAAVARACASDPNAAFYWAHHLARWTYFVAQGTAAFMLADLPVLLQGGVSRLQRMQETDGQAQSLVLECVQAWMQDYAWIKRGVYAMPWDMVTPGAQQNNPLVIAHRVVRAVEEHRVMVLRASAAGSQEDQHTWLKGPMYPQYYTKAFHHQTDGWFSSHSAERWEGFEEIIFMGRTDAMQRNALVPISEYVARNKAPGQLKLLEVAAGTGRFHTFIKDNWPDMRTVVSDLSPFYLQQARENLREWKRLRQPRKRLGGLDDMGVEFMQMAAEKLDLPDASVDIVVSTYLLHELPRPVRQRAVEEMYRVLKPGGLCVVNDSIQLGDRPPMDDTLSLYGAMGEPYYVDYMKHDLGALHAAAGFQPGTKWLSSVTKTLSFVKPL